MTEISSPLPVTIETDATADNGEFADYLRRLGCTVTTTDEGQLRAFVTYPETVEDEEAALWAWCENWARRHHVAIQVCFEPAT